MAMDQAETFEWLRKRSQRLDETLAERDALKNRLRSVHQYHCTPDNCNLDGGPEHEEFFDNGGAPFPRK